MEIRIMHPNPDVDPTIDEVKSHNAFLTQALIIFQSAMDLDDESMNGVMQAVEDLCGIANTEPIDDEKIHEYALEALQILKIAMHQSVHADHEHSDYDGTEHD